LNFVLDASATLAWVFADEAHDRAWPIIESMQQFTAFAPAHYPLEVANGLLTALRRGRLTPDQAATAAVALAMMPIQIDPDTQEKILDSTWALAVRHRLTIYDAAYLELAMRHLLPLVTLDEALSRAAVTEGIALVIPRK
jgi:predicted nucleic acid-binding protein